MNETVKPANRCWAPHWRRSAAIAAQTSRPGEEPADAKEQCCTLAVLYLDMIDSLGLSAATRNTNQSESAHSDRPVHGSARGLWPTARLGPAVPPASQASEVRSTAGAVPQVVEPNLLAGSPPERPVFGKETEIQSRIASLCKPRGEAEAT